MRRTSRISRSELMTADGKVVSYLNVSSVQVEDGGEWTCTAANAAGSASHSARLNVYGLPYVRAIPKITAVADANVTVRCPAAGYPLLDVVWSKGNCKRNASFRL